MAEELRGLRAAEFDVVATVADGNALLQATDDYQPDVVVTDIVADSHYPLLWALRHDLKLTVASGLLG
jgi:hypothetical protein